MKNGNWSTLSEIHFKNVFNFITLNNKMYNKNIVSKKQFCATEVFLRHCLKWLEKCDYLFNSNLWHFVIFSESRLNNILSWVFLSLTNSFHFAYLIRKMSYFTKPIFLSITILLQISFSHNRQKVAWFLWQYLI